MQLVWRRDYRAVGMADLQIIFDCLKPFRTKLGRQSFCCIIRIDDRVKQSIRPYDFDVLPADQACAHNRNSLHFGGPPAFDRCRRKAAVLKGAFMAPYPV